MPSGAAGGKMPQPKIADVEILAVDGGPALAICAFSTIRTVAGSLLMASVTPEVANDRRHHVTLPVPVRRPVPGAAPQADRGAKDRLLPQRAEALALKDAFGVAHFAGIEKGLEAIVGRPREDHAAQDLAPLINRQRRFNRRPAQKSVAVVEQLFARLRHSRVGGHPNRRLGQPLREPGRVQP